MAQKKEAVVMWGIRRRRSHGNKNRKKVETAAGEEKLEVLEADAESVCEDPAIRLQAEFAIHMAHYIGQTVTIFVKGGGALGSGFTGILSCVTESYVQLISRLGPAPSCPLFNPCLIPCNTANQFKSFPCWYDCASGKNAVATTGSIAYIPIHKLAGFVHSGL